MEGKDNIKDLFNEKLSGFEGNVRPELWSSISSQIGTPVATSVGAGMSLLTKTILGLSVAASVGVIGVYLFTRSSGDTHEKATIESNTKQTGLKKQNGVALEVKEQQPLSINSSDDIENIKDESYNSIQSETIDMVSSEQSNKNNTVSVYTAPVYVENNSNQHKEVAAIEDKVVLVKEEKITEPTNVVTPEVSAEGAGKETVIYIEDLPNIFTPNGDGTNDYLAVKTNNVTDFSIVVLDQNNKIVYQSTDAAFNWNGTSMAGDHVPNGSYVYYVTARNGKGELITKHSRLTINR